MTTALTQSWPQEKWGLKHIPQQPEEVRWWPLLFFYTCLKLMSSRLTSDVCWSLKKCLCFHQDIAGWWRQWLIHQKSYSHGWLSKHHKNLVLLCEQPVLQHPCGQDKTICNCLFNDNCICKVFALRGCKLNFPVSITSLGKSLGFSSHLCTPTHVLVLRPIFTYGHDTH